MMHLNAYTRKSRIFLSAIITTLTLSSTAFAAGFQISEQSGTGLGRAFAGWGVIGDDLSNAFYNPAGITQLSGTQIQVAGFLVNGNSRFSDDGTSNAIPGVGPVPGIPVGANRDGGTLGLVPNLYFVTDLTEKIKYGFSITAPFGLKTDYDGDFVGRFTANESELVTIDINPSIGFAVNDAFSIGFGVSAQYAEATLSQAVFNGPGVADGFAEVEGDDWSYGWNVGVMYHPDPSFRVGVGFRSKIGHDLDGEDNDISGVPALGGNFSSDVSARATLPETVYAGLYKEFASKWGLSLGLRWTRWNRLDEIVIVTESPIIADSILELQWENSISANIGIDYFHSDKWTFRAGYMFDETPTQDEFRTPRIPDEDRHWVAIGASYNYNEHMQFDAGYTHLFFEDAEINVETPIGGPIVNNLVGDFEDTDVDILTFQATYKF